MGIDLPYHPTARAFGFIAEEMVDDIRASHSSADSQKCAVPATSLRNDTHKSAENRESWNEYRLAARRIEDAAVRVTRSITRCQGRTFCFGSIGVRSYDVSTVTAG
jgi:hypothetical protein